MAHFIPIGLAGLAAVGLACGGGPADVTDSLTTGAATPASTGLTSSGGVTDEHPTTGSPGSTSAPGATTGEADTTGDSGDGPPQPECDAETLAGPYVDPPQFTQIYFGAYSHWAQPWRAYLETVPATTFLDGVGIHLNYAAAAPDLLLQMLASHGIRHMRIEISWGLVGYDDETQITAAPLWKEWLAKMKQHGIRPLILLNAHQGAPCPMKTFERLLAADANAGDTSITLTDASDLVVGRSGLSGLTTYWAAEALVTDIVGNTITLSKPLPTGLPAGTGVSMATLKYRPFSPPGTADYAETIGGWTKYVGTVAELAADALGTADEADKGFDMEIWNELTFGSEFLYVNHYYATPPYDYVEIGVWANIVQATSDFAGANPALLAGVPLGNGFANTIPWPASSVEPRNIRAIDKHPYYGRATFPDVSPVGDGLNALYEKDAFLPAYEVEFPEYFATAIQTETLVRDMGPIPSDVLGYTHGRNARVIDGEIVPCSVWLTEININPFAHDLNVTAERAMALKEKASLRTWSFYLNKGATRVDLYGVASGSPLAGDTGLGIVPDAFLEYASQPGATYPADDSPYTSPTLRSLGRIVDKMSDGLDSSLDLTRPLELAKVRACEHNVQFVGDGTAARPDLRHVDVLAFLPFQVNATKFIVHYYVMTRDVTDDMPPESFTLTLHGVDGSRASVTAYDPIEDTAVPVEVHAGDPNSTVVTVSATDYPRLLIVDETP